MQPPAGEIYAAIIPSGFRGEDPVIRRALLTGPVIAINQFIIFGAAFVKLGLLSTNSSSAAGPVQSSWNREPSVIPPVSLLGFTVLSGARVRAHGVFAALMLMCVGGIASGSIEVMKTLLFREMFKGRVG